jgi:hypothetical protein
MVGDGFATTSCDGKNMFKLLIFAESQKFYLLKNCVLRYLCEVCYLTKAPFFYFT